MLSDINSHRNDSHKAAENMSDNFRDIKQRVSHHPQPPQYLRDTRIWGIVKTKGPSTITIDWVARKRKATKSGLLLPRNNSVLHVN